MYGAIIVGDDPYGASTDEYRRTRNFGHGGNDAMLADECDDTL